MFSLMTDRNQELLKESHLVFTWWWSCPVRILLGSLRIKSDIGRILQWRFWNHGSLCSCPRNHFVLPSSHVKMNWHKNLNFSYLVSLNAQWNDNLF
jgi:hypothetical protein